MALTYSKPGSMGSLAPQFSLPGVDGKVYQLSSFQASKALVIVFMCNHCPYVIATQNRINQLAKEYAPRGVSLIGINSNDASRYPADNFEAMIKQAKEQNYVFPYLFDETQEVAQAYGAVCTPEFYAYRNEGAGRFVLEYLGRLDDQWKDEIAVTKRELASALDLILEGQKPAYGQNAAMGCSIKWKI